MRLGTRERERTRESRPTSGGGRRFKYRPRTVDEINARKSQQGGAREGFIRGDLKVWTPREGDNTVRLLMPTWENPSAIGYEIWAHYSIGPDNSAFLCLDQMKKEDCPVCEERMIADKAGDDELAAELKPKKRSAFWIIDRAHEEIGPQVWVVPWTLERDIYAVMLDKKSGESLPVDSLGDDGYDLSFIKEKKKGQQFFDYVGVQFDRRPSPLHDDEDVVKEWEDFIWENPIPEVLVFHDHDHIKEAFGGEITETRADKEARRKARKEGDGEDRPRRAAREEPEERPARRSSRREEPEEKDERPSRRAAKEEPPEEEPAELPTWDEVHELNEKKLTELADAFDIDFGDRDFDDLEAAADFLCEELDIQKPRKATARSRDEEPEERKERPRLALKSRSKTNSEDDKGSSPRSAWKDKLDRYKK
jgi:hypothetical protein